MSKQIQQVIEFDWNRIGCYSRYSRVDGYTMAFAFPKKSKPFIVKGGRIRVKDFFEGYRSVDPVFVKYTYWNKGQRYVCWDIYGGLQKIKIKSCHVRSIYRDSIKSRKDKYPHGYTICIKLDNGKAGYDFEKFVRRVPDKWMKEFDQFFYK